MSWTEEQFLGAFEHRGLESADAWLCVGENVPQKFQVWILRVQGRAYAKKEEIRRNKKQED